MKEMTSIVSITKTLMNMELDWEFDELSAEIQVNHDERCHETSSVLNDGIRP